MQKLLTISYIKCLAKNESNMILHMMKALPIYKSMIFKQDSILNSSKMSMSWKTNRIEVGVSLF
jgi:hypothetical protein